MANSGRIPGYAAEASLTPPSRAYRSMVSNAPDSSGTPVTAQMLRKRLDSCNPFCVCQSGITAENCPCCGYGTSYLARDPRGLKA